MIPFLGAIFLVIGFVVLMKVFAIIEKSSAVVTVARLAFSDIRNPNLNDDAKEVALQGHAKQLFVLFLLLTLGGTAALILPAAGLWVFELMGVLTLDAAMATALSWEFLSASTVCVLLVLWVNRKR